MTVLEVIREYELVNNAPQPEEQVAAIIAHLERIEYSEQQLRLALPWIFRGDPSKYGRLRLRDFFPPRQELESIGVDVGSLLRAEYDRGRQEAYEMGRRDGIGEMQRDTERLRLLKETEDVRKRELNNEYLNGRAQAAKALEHALDERKEKLDAEEKRLERARRMLDAAVAEAYERGFRDGRSS